jgi:DNA topoisomerase-1
MKLVIVESPAKCSKIQSYLGDGYIVKATMGHIRALDESLDSVGIERDWTPRYVELSTKKDAIAKLRSAAKDAEVILATDDDREGEGIAWHVCFLLKLNPATTPRIVFHEITKPAIQAAVAAPRRLDMNKVNAQQARAMLDLLVGFTISKVLWNRVAPKLSAGRCQTPALRLVKERDAEVENHRATAFWRLNGTWSLSGTATMPIIASLEAQSIEDVPDRASAEAALHKVYETQDSILTSVKESISTSNAPKPFITSTLQQEASSCHGLNPKVTMHAAQKLYEAGLITYMRTDNPVLSEEAADAIRTHITATYGTEYVGEPGQHVVSPGNSTSKGAAEAAEAAKKPKKTTKKATVETEKPAAQAAHEAIRPTHPEDTDPAIADDIQRTVYKLIWRRSMQSQMSPARTNVRKITIAIKADPDRLYEAQQTKTEFQGWQITEPKDPKKVVASEEVWAAWTPYAKVNTPLKWQSLHANEQFTKPRGRYTEASLIAELEKRGIGRPSTFASLVSTILDRNYVEKTNAEGKPQICIHLALTPARWPPAETSTEHKVGADRNKLRSTALGRTVSEFLEKEYADLFAYEFTASMESDLDTIAQGAKEYKSLLQTTWDTYKDRYASMTAGGAKEAKAARERVLGDGVKVILSAKGPLFVRDPPPGSPKSVKATFAALLSSHTYDSVTADDADAAFTAAALAKAGEHIGDMDGAEIRKKRGPYGFYAECKGVRVPLKGGEDLEQIKEKLIAKLSFAAAGESAYTRRVGDFTIKRGPYGLYFYKHTLKRVQFVKFPPSMDADKVTVSDITNLYSTGLAAKRKPKSMPAVTKTHIKNEIVG